MLENFIYAKTKDLFLEKLNTGEVLEEAIAFIEDTKEIWTHGNYFNCTSVDSGEYITKSELHESIENAAFIEDYDYEVIVPVSNIVTMSQSEYNTLAEKNNNTIYLII